MQQKWVAWLSAAAWDAILVEAIAKEPLETGGVLLGYWAAPTEVVVTRAVGPGRHAVHRKTSFVPDHAFHVAEIAGHYERSAGVEVYLGDWHTHPGATVGTPSSKDRSAVKRIAADPEARAPKALTMIVAGKGCSWEPSLWVGCVEPLFALWTKLRLAPCVVHHCA